MQSPPGWRFARATVITSPPRNEQTHSDPRSAISAGGLTVALPAATGGDPLSEQEDAVGFFNQGEAHSRSLLKAVSWRLTGSIDTFTIGFIVTGRIGIAGTIASVEIVTKIVLYYLHERAWMAIPWGRR